MPGKLLPPVPEKLQLGGREGRDQTVVLLAIADAGAEEALTQWMRALLVYRLAVSGKVMSSADGRAVAVMRTHPTLLASIAERRPECVNDLITLPRELLANL